MRQQGAWTIKTPLLGVRRISLIDSYAPSFGPFGILERSLHHHHVCYTVIDVVVPVELHVPREVVKSQRCGRFVRPVSLQSVPEP